MNIKFNNILAIAILIGGLALAIYVGLYLMFVGGIAQAVGSLTISPINPMSFAIGITKVIGAWFTGTAIATASFILAVIIDKE